MLVVDEVAVVDDSPVTGLFDRQGHQELDVFHEWHSVWRPFLVTPFPVDPRVPDDALVVEARVIVEGDVVVVDEMVDSLSSHDVDGEASAVTSRSSLDPDL